MKPIICVVLLFIISLFLTSSYAQEIKKAKSNLTSENENNSLIKNIEENSSLFPNNTQISIAIIDGANTKYIGVIRKNDVLEFTDNKNKVFEIGSISKVFTSVLFSHFINEKKASLDEKVQNTFDFELKNGKAITLQQLTNHTSGLPRIPSNMAGSMLSFNNPYVNYTPKLLETYLTKSIKLENPIGTKSAYSNLGAGLLGYILTKKSGKSYENLLQEIIFKPLQMNSSSAILKKLKDIPLVYGLNANGTQASNWDFTDALVGAGGIKSTMVDMEKFARKNFEKNALYSLPQQPTFKISNHLKMGMGWHISTPKEKSFLWHNGGTGGYRSCMVIDKENKKSIIVLSNVSAFNKQSGNIDKLCFSLLKNL